MVSKGREIPKFLVSTRYISVLITFIVLFSILFMVLYDPFSMAVWFSTDDMMRFSFTILFYFSAVVILIISRSLMYSLQDRIYITPWRYIWWLMCENIAISLLYTIITEMFFPVDGVVIPELATRSLFCVTFILAIPNALVSFYAAYRAKCEELEASQYEMQRLSEEFKRLQGEQERASVDTTIKPTERVPKMINLHDNNGILRLTINIDSLYYLESEDNYIKVHYKHNDKIASYMLRCRTRAIEQSLQGTGMVRCHRSYIVNVRKIEFIGEERRMHYLTLKDDSIKRIPVSKSYYDNLMDTLNSTIH